MHRWSSRRHDSQRLGRRSLLVTVESQCLGSGHDAPEFDRRRQHGGPYRPQESFLMKLARTIGTVTLSRCHPAMEAAVLRCVEMVNSVDQIDKQPLGGDTVVAWDLCGTGIGDLVALAEGPESAQPFRPDVKPLDASIVALLDEVDVTN